MRPTTDDRNEAGPAGAALAPLQHAASARATELVDEQPDAEDAGATGETVALSLATALVRATPAEVAQGELMLALVLGWSGEACASGARLPLRVLMPELLRSSAKAAPWGLSIADVGIDAPAEGLDSVSVLLYRLHRRARAQQVVASLRGLLDAASAAANPAAVRCLLQAAAERLHVLQAARDAEVLVAGSAVGLAAGAGANPRYLAFADAAPLWLRGRQLLRGATAAAASALTDEHAVLLRIGRRSTREGVLRYIDDLRRVHRLRRDDLDPSHKAESYLGRVAREVEQRRKAVLDALYGHHTMLPMVTPLALETAGDLEAVVTMSDDKPSRFRSLLEGMRDELSRVYGVTVPAWRVRLNTTELPAGNALVMIGEVPLVMVQLQAGRQFCLASPQRLAVMGIEAEPATHPADGSECAWIDAAGVAAASERFEVWDLAQVLAAHLQGLLRDHLREFLGVDDIVQALRDGDGPQWLARIASSAGGLGRFRAVLLALLDEQLPVQPLPALARHYVERIAEPVAVIAEALRCIEPVRAHIVRDLPGWRLFVLAQDFSDLLATHVLRDGDAAVLALEPEATQEALSAVREALRTPEPVAAGGIQVVVVEDASLRPFVRKLVALEFPKLRVVARRELAGQSLPSAPIAIALD